MNGIDQNALIPLTNTQMELLNNMDPARTSMAVVEPAAMPIPVVPPDTFIVLNQTHLATNDMDTDSDIIVHPTEESDAPMTDAKISIEEAELAYPVDANFDWINNKIKMA